jgi:hypothetical protein
LSHKWNVYKVFSNGRRAKAPLQSFTHEDPETVEEHFESKIKVSFAGKAKRAKFILIRSDLPQNRCEESVDKEQKLFEQNKMRVFQKHFCSVGKQKIRNTHIATGLILCEKTGWKWQWAFIEAATSRYLGPLSSRFSTYSAAQAWMQAEIREL